MLALVSTESIQKYAKFASAFLCLLMLLSLDVFARPLTIDDVLKKVSIDKLVYHPGRGIVVFEYDDEAALGVERAFHKGVPAQRMRKLYFSSISRPENGLFFPQEAGVSYLLPSSSPFSPDGKHLAFFELRGGKVRPGVFEIGTQKVSVIDFASDFPTLIWVNNDELLVIGAHNENEFGQYGAYGNDLAWENAREQSRKREAAHKNLTETAVVAGGGRYAITEYPPIDRDLAKISLAAGEVKVLSRAKFMGRLGAFALSPDGRWLASTVADPYGVRGQKALLDRSDSVYRNRLVVVDLLNGISQNVVEERYVAPQLLSWAKGSSNCLLFYSYPENGNKPQGRLHIYSPGEKTITDLDVAKGSAREEVSDGDYIPHAYWVGDTVVYRDRVDGRWRKGAVNGETALLETMLSDLPARPVAISNTEMFFLSDGRVWRVGLDGKTIPITGDELVLNKEHLGSRAGQPVNERVNGLFPFDRTPFVVTGGDLNTIYYFSTDGRQIAQASILNTPDVRILAANRSGVVYTSYSNKWGSTLAFRPSDTEQEAKTLFRYNRHMANVDETVGPVKINHSTPDGDELISWLYLPPSADLMSLSKFPLVVIPYAGRVFSDRQPRGLWGGRVRDASVSIPTSAPIFTAEGYGVLFPSIPLSKAPEDPLTAMLDPVMSAIDAAIETGHIDPDRVAISGHSFGGYSALSLAVQSDRFKAVIATASLSNLVSSYGELSEGSRLTFSRHLFASMYTLETGQKRMGSVPWGDADRYVRNSPFFHADEVTSPVMLIHGDLDVVSIAQAEQFYAALMRQDKDVQFIRYVGEGHIIRSPKNQKDMWERVLQFLEDNGVTPGLKTVH